LQHIADLCQVRVEDIPGNDREKMELLNHAQETLEESGEEFFLTTLGLIDRWRDFLAGVIP
jgi:hypothetical protein